MPQNLPNMQMLMAQGMASFWLSRAAAEPFFAVTILFPPLCCWDNKWKRRVVLCFVILHILLYDILYTVENLKKRRVPRAVEKTV